MWWLMAGVLLWSVAHLSGCLAPGPRARLLNRVGEPVYKGIFSLVMVASIVMIVVGWRSSVPYSVYRPPQWGHLATLILMVPAIILFVASNMPTNLKRVLRHPQLTGFALWAAIHLLSNGDRNSVVLFGGLALWAILQIVLINRRDGAWTRPAAVPVMKDLIPVVVGIAVFAVLLWAHPFLAGMPIF